MCELYGKKCHSVNVLGYEIHHKGGIVMLENKPSYASQLFDLTRAIFNPKYEDFSPYW